MLPSSTCQTSPPLRPLNNTRGHRQSFSCAPPSFCTMLFSILIISLSLVSSVQALSMELAYGAVGSTHFKQLASRGEIHTDRRNPPPLPHMRLGMRQDNSDDEPATSTSSILAESPSHTTEPTSVSSTQSQSRPTASNSPTSTTSETPSITIITTPIPSPFDTSLGTNFTSQACPDYFNTFLSNSTFKSCIPVSLLLQNSNSFFRAERDSALLSETLDAACNAPVSLCAPLLLAIADDLIKPENCGTDFEQQNPLVAQAYAGLMAYEPIYHATCLQDAESGQYCFSEAITNASSPSDAYPYYTALGMNLPTGSRPTCSQCLHGTMSLFASFATNGNQPLSKTYVPCALQVDQTCGSAFANTTVAVVTNYAPRTTSPTSALRLLVYFITLLAAVSTFS